MVKWFIQSRPNDNQLHTSLDFGHR